MNLKSWTQSPYLNLMSGLVLLFTSGYESWSTIANVSIGAHHGVLVFSIIQLLKVIPELMHGLKEIEEGANLKCS